MLKCCRLFDQSCFQALTQVELAFAKPPQKNVEHLRTYSRKHPEIRYEPCESFVIKSFVGYWSVLIWLCDPCRSCESTNPANGGFWETGFFRDSIFVKIHFRWFILPTYLFYNQKYRSTLDHHKSSSWLSNSNFHERHCRFSGSLHWLATTIWW